MARPQSWASHTMPREAVRRPGVARIVAAWPRMQPALKAVIVAIAVAANGTQGRDSWVVPQLRATT